MVSLAVSCSAGIILNGNNKYIIVFWPAQKTKVKVDGGWAVYLLSVMVIMLLCDGVQKRTA